jgi:hypothetical protein
VVSDEIKLGDAIYVYSRLEEMAKELQRTRSTAKMGMSMLRAVGHGLHLPVALQTQDLSSDEAANKVFYDAVIIARSGLSSYQGRFADMTRKLTKEDTEKLLRLVRYAIQATKKGMSPVGDEKKVTKNQNQIIQRLQICSLLNDRLSGDKWMASDMDVSQVQTNYRGHH